MMHVVKWGGDGHERDYKNHDGDPNSSAAVHYIVIGGILE